LPWLIGAAVIPAVIVGLAVWFFASGGGGGSSERQNADVTNVLNVFNSQQGVAAKRYEGSLAPGYPDDIPTYPGARLVSSMRQIPGADVEYYAVYDTSDARHTVAQYFADKFDSDPWQLQGGQTSADSTIHQFSRVDSADVTGVVVVAESDKDKVTTILMITRVASGAKDAPKDAYSPADVTDQLPVGFPDSVPAYPGSNTVQSAYQKKSGTRQFAVSWVTKDDATTALSYYRDAFKNNGWTVADAAADPTQTGGAAPSGQSIQFTDDKSQLSGSVTVGAFEQDDSYTRIDVQVTSPSSGTSGG
jgi:hypothetical protein